MKVKGRIEGFEGDRMTLVIDSTEVFKLPSIYQSYKDKDLSVELKQFRKRRTLDQNSFFHLLIRELAFQLYGSYEKSFQELLKAGIKDLYGYKIKFKEKFIPKPSSICDTVEMGSLIEGCFMEASEQGIDMTEFLQQWEEIKKEKEGTK